LSKSNIKVDKYQFEPQHEIVSEVHAVCFMANIMDELNFN